MVNRKVKISYKQSLALKSVPAFQKFVLNIKYSGGLKYYFILNLTLSTLLSSVSGVGVLYISWIFFYQPDVTAMTTILYWMSSNFPEATAPIIAARLLFVSTGSWVSGEIWRFG